MTNKKNKYPVPKFRNLVEEDRYWQSHSPLMEGYEGEIQKKKQNRASFLSIRLTGEELARLREKAAGYSLGPSTYARQLLTQGIESSDTRFLPPDFLLRLFNIFHSSTGEPKEEYLQKLKEIYSEYLELQESMAQQIVSVCIPNELLKELGKITAEKEMER